MYTSRASLPRSPISIREGILSNSLEAEEDVTSSSRLDSSASVCCRFPSFDTSCEEISVSFSMQHCKSCLPLEAFNWSHDSGLFPALETSSYHPALRAAVLDVAFA